MDLMGNVGIIIIITTIIRSLGSRPSPYVRVLIARGGQIEQRGRPGMIQ